MDRHNLLIHNWIGKKTNWNRREEAEAFLRAFVAKVEPNAQVEVTSELSEVYTLHLSMANKQTGISVYYEELINSESRAVHSKRDLDSLETLIYFR